MSYVSAYAVGEMSGAVFDTAIQISLHTGEPGNSGADNEVTGGNYARIEVAAADWTTTVGTTVNDNIVDFGDPTWTATVSHYALWNTTSNFIGWAALSAPKTVDDNTTNVSIAAQSIEFIVQSAATA